MKIYIQYIHYLINLETQKASSEQQKYFGIVISALQEKSQPDMRKLKPKQQLYLVCVFFCLKWFEGLG